MGVDRRLDSIADKPAWVFDPQGGCGPKPARVFEYQLDTNKLSDLGVQDSDAPTDTPPPTNPLGPAFTVTSEHPAVIQVHTTACKGNYEWFVDLDYDYKGQRRTKSFGPYRTFGKAENTTLYIGQIKDEKGNFPPIETMNGAPQKCQQ